MCPHLNKIVIYQSKSGSLELKADIKKETIWLTQQQVGSLFNVKKAAISKHLNNIFKIGELTKDATVSKMETVQREGKRLIRRNIEFYNLDLVLSIGYRVNSLQATNFRKWATKTLREYLTKGYLLNKKRISINYEKFIRAVDDVKNIIPTGSSIIDNKDILDLVTFFADTWFSLDAFDKNTLISTGHTKKHVEITSDNIYKSLLSLKNVLLSKKQASDLFAAERDSGALESIVRNVMQSYAGKELYPTIEEKAAHLLYFIVKNHPFIDGNKRSGAYVFAWLLRFSGVLNTNRITPPVLTVLTLLIAESNPKQKDKMIKLILTLLSNIKL